MSEVGEASVAPVTPSRAARAAPPLMPTSRPPAATQLRSACDALLAQRLLPRGGVAVRHDQHVGAGQRAGGDVAAP